MHADETTTRRHDAVTFRLKAEATGDLSPREPLFPIFLKLRGRRVLLVGAGRVAAEKLRHLIDAGAVVSVVAPEISDAVRTLLTGVRQTGSVTIYRRRFVAGDLDGVWLAVAAAPPEVNRQVAAAAEARRVFVNAVDDVKNASAYLGGVVRRGGVTLAASTDGEAPALAGLLREALEMVLPDDLDRWMECAREARRHWLAAGTPMGDRRPMLLDALVTLYAGRTTVPIQAGSEGAAEVQR